MPTARPTADVSTSGWVTSTGSTSLFGALSDGDRATYASSKALDARYRRGRVGTIFIITDDEDAHQSDPKNGRTLFDTLMNQAGTRFPNVEGAHAKCEAMRATEAAIQYQQTTGISSGGCWNTDPRPGIMTVAADASDGYLAMDFTKTIWTALWGTVGHRNAFTGKAGKFINQWEGSVVDDPPPFMPPGFDYATLICNSPEGPGGGTLGTAGYQPYTVIRDADGNITSQGINLEGAPTYPALPTTVSRNQSDWVGDRFVDMFRMWLNLPASDARYQLPFFFELTPTAPHFVHTPLPSKGAGLSVAEVAAREAIETFYGCPQVPNPTTYFIPTQFDYRRVKVTGVGQWRINYRGVWTSTFTDLPSAATVQAAMRALASPYITGTETVTLSGSTYTIKMNDCGDGDFTKPNAVVLTFDTTHFTGTIDSAWPNIDVNDVTCQGTKGLYTTSSGGPNGTNVTTECIRLGHLASGVDRGLIQRIIDTLNDPAGDGSIPSILNQVDIYYTSDNGTFSGNGAHYRVITANTKDDLYNTDMEVPFVARGPGIAAGATNLAPIQLPQLSAMFLDELRGVTTAADIQSVMVSLGGANNPTVGRDPDQLSCRTAIYTDPTAQDNKVFPMKGSGQYGVRVGNRWRYWIDSSPDSSHQTLDFSGCTSCTFTITFLLPVITVVSGIASMTFTECTTDPIAWTSASPPTAAFVQTKLQAVIPSSSAITVTLGGSTYTVSFGDASGGGTYGGATYAQANLPPLRLDVTSVVGSAPDPGVSKAGHPATSLYDIVHDPFELINLAGLGGPYAAIETFCAQSALALNGTGTGTGCTGSTCYTGIYTSTLL